MSNMKKNQKISDKKTNALQKQNEAISNILMDLGSKQSNSKLNPIKQAVDLNASRWSTEPTKQAKVENFAVDNINFNTIVVEDAKPSEVDKFKKITDQNLDTAKKFEKHLKKISKELKKKSDQDTAIKSKKSMFKQNAEFLGALISKELLGRLKKASSKVKDDFKEKAKKYAGWLKALLMGSAIWKALKFITAIPRMAWKILSGLTKVGWKVIKSSFWLAKNVGLPGIKMLGGLAFNMLKAGAGGLVFLFKFIKNPIKTLTGVWIAMQKKWNRFKRKRAAGKYLSAKRKKAAKAAKLAKAGKWARSLTVAMRLVRAAGTVGLIVAGVYLVSKVLGVKDEEWKGAIDAVIEWGKYGMEVVKNWITHSEVYKDMVNWWDNLNVRQTMDIIVNDLGDFWRELKADPTKAIGNMVKKGAVGVLNALTAVPKLLTEYLWDGWLKPKLMDMLDVNILTFNLAELVWPKEFKSYTKRAGNTKDNQKRYDDILSQKYDRNKQTGLLKYYFIQKRGTSKFNKTEAKATADRIYELTGVDVTQYKSESEATRAISEAKKDAAKNGLSSVKSLGDFYSLKRKRRKQKERAQ
jgi:hypothetical protein